MRPTSFETWLSTARGRRAEDVIIHKIKTEENGYITLAADIDERGVNGGPRMRSTQDANRLPDILASLKGYSFWGEIKGKTKPDWTHITGWLEHGIGLNCWYDYLGVRDISGIPVVVFVYEFRSGRVLYRNIDILRELRGTSDCRFSNGPDSEGNIFFPLHVFRTWGIITKFNDDFYEQAEMFGQNGDEQWFKIERRAFFLEDNSQ